MAKIRVSSAAGMTAEYPTQALTRITITSSHDVVISHLQPLPNGHVLNPLIDAELEDKFCSFIRTRGTEERAGEALKVLWATKHIANAVSIVGLFRAGD